MQLHIGYEAVEPFTFARHDELDNKTRAAGLQPKALLKSNPAVGSILLDSETSLSGVPLEARVYRLGNRCVVDWVLNQHQERKPRVSTIRERFESTASPTTRIGASTC